MYKRSREAINASAAVQRALGRGELIRPDRCNRCGKKCKPDAHHEDYNKPLEVEWLCSRCHKKHHPHDVEAWRVSLFDNETRV